MIELTPVILDKISKHKNTNDRIAFQRRLTNLEEYVKTHINPIEENILLQRERLIPLYDTVHTMRMEAREYCTHPPEHLVVTSDDEQSISVRCKFCDETFHIEK